MPDVFPSATGIIIWGIAMIFIGIPMMSTTLRAMYLRIIQRQMTTSNSAELWWILSMVRLPETIRRSQRWFVPVYYGSIAVFRFNAELCAPVDV